MGIEMRRCWIDIEKSRYFLAEPGLVGVNVRKANRYRDYCCLYCVSWDECDDKHMNMRLTPMALLELIIRDEMASGIATMQVYSGNLSWDLLFVEPNLFITNIVSWEIICPFPANDPLKLNRNVDSKLFFSADESTHQTNSVLENWQLNRRIPGVLFSRLPIK